MWLHTAAIELRLSHPVHNLGGESLEEVVWLLVSLTGQGSGHEADPVFQSYTQQPAPTGSQEAYWADRKHTSQQTSPKHKLTHQNEMPVLRNTIYVLRRNAKTSLTKKHKAKSI